jgi:hypothetical protein
VTARESSVGPLGRPLAECGVLYRLAADALVLVHFAFIVFVVLGGFLTWRWRRLAWLHIPAVAWGALIEFMGWICPLTPLEVSLRRMAGGAGYEGGFIAHYILPIIYPAGLTPTIQVMLGVLLVLLNGVAYFVYFKRRNRLRQ